MLTSHADDVGLEINAFGTLPNKHVRDMRRHIFYMYFNVRRFLIEKNHFI